MKNQYTADEGAGGGSMTDHGMEPWQVPGMPENVGHASRNAMREVAATQTKNKSPPADVADIGDVPGTTPNYTHVGKRLTGEVTGKSSGWNPPNPSGEAGD